jgi:hypothetical protein
MPLHPNAIELIENNLLTIQRGISKAKAVEIGELSKEQLEAINTTRALYLATLKPIIPTVLFIGRHIYQSRIVNDGYTIQDVIEQITSAMNECAKVSIGAHTTLQNLTPRPDAYGNKVRDMIILECSSKHPRPELFSVIPKGDIIKPVKK